MERIKGPRFHNKTVIPGSDTDGSFDYILTKDGLIKDLTPIKINIVPDDRCGSSIGGADYPVLCNPVVKELV